MSEVKLTTEQFLALSKPDQRVVLAKDVIKILQAKKIIARRLTYFVLNDEAHSASVNSEYFDQEIDKVIGKTRCEACAIGSLFVAEVMYTDKAKVSDANSYFIKERLYEYFDEKQVELIEIAFERDVDFAESCEEPVEDTILAAANYISSLELLGDDYYFIDSEDAMILIMNNIIEHNGEFVP